MLRATDVSFAYGAIGRSAAIRCRTTIRELTHWTGARTACTDGVSLEVERGTIVGLLGPNGSGKTTLLRIVAGILQPLAGRVSLDGRPIEQLTRRELARRIAVVPQETHSTFDFSVLDMVLMGRYPHLGPFELEGAADQEIARDALAATGTAALETRAFATLERRREAARRHRQRARAGVGHAAARRADGVARSSAISSRSRRCCGG